MFWEIPKAVPLNVRQKVVAMFPDFNFLVNNLGLIIHSNKLLRLKTPGDGVLSPRYCNIIR